MSLHTSLGKGSSMQRHRSVIKRHEKLQLLKEKGTWDEARGILGLPKVKVIKIKAKKEKTAKAADAAAPAGAAGKAAAPAAAAGAKPAAAAGKTPAKPAAEKKK